MDNYNMFIMCASIAAILFLLLTVLIVFWCIEGSLIKKKFQKEYGITLPKGVHVNTHKSGYYINYSVLCFPYWLYSNNDGTKNKRYSNNRLIYNMNSTLHFNKYIIKSSSPFIIVNIVTALRQKYGDNIIEKNEEELRKYQNLQLQAYKTSKISEIKNVTNEFADNPYKFEEYCATLYREMGYKVTTTPKSNDGGYDLLLTKDSKVYIAECKCYSMGNKIGRPYIQKLVGANQEIKADGMIFITTSDFTQEAVSYASNTGVELVNGDKMAELTKEYLNGEAVQLDIGNKWYLTENDLKKFFPKDVFI
ncbi:MAG: restriction endonuclease [Clostridia bacterium]|nr:restriction endonuclease [Clostridia bacterium]